MSKIWQVWIEGYNATGNSKTASLKGLYWGETFQDAVKAYAETLNPNDRSYFNSDFSAFWGCKFYDNEADARRMFG